MAKNETKRWHVLAGIIKENGFRDCAEIGVKSGRNIAEICLRCPNTTWVAVDPWCGTDSYAHWSKGQIQRHEREFDEVHEHFGDRIRKVKAFSVDAAPDVPDGSLDLVFIDGDHSYKSVRADIDAWLPKVRKGGVISGHDFDNTNKYGDAFKGVDRAVHETFGDDFKVYPDHVWAARV